MVLALFLDVAHDRGASGADWEKPFKKKYMHKSNEVIVSAINAINQILLMDDVIDKHKKEMLSNMIWKITEAGGKYTTTYLSKKVFKIRSSGNKSNIGLNHEHVFTRKELIRKLLTNPKKAKSILKNAIACTVTKLEHRKLSSVKDVEGWERYKKAGIKVYSTTANQWII